MRKEYCLVSLILMVEGLSKKTNDAVKKKKMIKSSSSPLIKIAISSINYEIIDGYLLI